MAKRRREDNQKYGMRENTKKATSTAWRNWEEFCEELGYAKTIDFGATRREREIMTEKLADWLHWNTERVAVKGKNRGKKAMNSSDSFVAYLAAVQRATKAMGKDWIPTGRLEETVKRICKQYGAGMNRKLPLFVSMVNEMEDKRVLDERSEREAQTIVIVLFTVFGLLRISEALKLEWKDVCIEEAAESRRDGRREKREIMTLTLRNTKTSKGQNCPPEYAVICNRTEEEAEKKRRWDPIEMFRKWKRRCDDHEIDTKRGKIFSIKRADYDDKLKEALQDIGVESPEYGTHSGRIGGATMLWEAGATDSEIMEIGRWKSDCWKIYCRQVKERCLRLSRVLNESKLRRGSLVGEKMDLTIEVEDEIS